MRSRGKETKTDPPSQIVTKENAWKLDADIIKAATRWAIMDALTRLLDEV